MGVQGNTPGKLDRSRSDEETSGARFPKGHSLPPGGGPDWGRGVWYGSGDWTGTGLGVWGGGLVCLTPGCVFALVRCTHSQPQGTTVTFYQGISFAPAALSPGACIGLKPLY